MAKNRAKAPMIPQPVKLALKLSADDRQLIANAKAQYEASEKAAAAALTDRGAKQGTMQFLIDQLTAKYHLRDGDVFNVETGAITRAAKPTKKK